MLASHSWTNTSTQKKIISRLSDIQCKLCADNQHLYIAFIMLYVLQCFYSVSMLRAIQIYLQNNRHLYDHMLIQFRQFTK